MATRSRVVLLADANPRLDELLFEDEALLLPEEDVLLLEEALLLLGAALLRLLEADELRPVDEPPRLDEERPPPLEAAPPSLATRSRVALLAEAKPRLDVLRLAEAFEVEELPEEDLREDERPPAADAPSEEDLLLLCADFFGLTAMC